MTMKRSGSDYWKLYHDDFWDSADVVALPQRTKAAYLFLLGLQAKHGSIPADPATIAALASVHFPGFIRWDWPHLERLFPVSSESNRVRMNPRQARETSVIDSSRESDAERKRTERAKKACCPLDVQPLGEERRGEEMRGEEKKEDSSASPAAGGSPQDATPKKPKAERKPATGPHAEVIQAFEAAFLKARGAPYAFVSGKDGSSVKKLLEFAGGDPRAVIDRIPLLFADRWWGPKATLSNFVAAWNGLTPPVKPKTEAESLFEYTAMRRRQEAEAREKAKIAWAEHEAKNGKAEKGVLP